MTLMVMNSRLSYPQSFYSEYHHTGRNVVDHDHHTLMHSGRNVINQHLNNNQQIQHHPFSLDAEQNHGWSNDQQQQRQQQNELRHNGGCNSPGFKLHDDDSANFLVQAFLRN